MRTVIIARTYAVAVAYAERKQLAGEDWSWVATERIARAQAAACRARGAPAPLLGLVVRRDHSRRDVPSEFLVSRVAL